MYNTISTTTTKNSIQIDIPKYYGKTKMVLKKKCSSKPKKTRKKKKINKTENRK